MTYCTKCGKQNLDTAKFCISCGGGLTTSVPPAFQKKKTGQWIIIGAIVLAGMLTASYFLFFNKKGNKNSSSSAKSGLTDDETAKLKELVYQWNDGLNRGSAADISSLYAERLVYYRNQMSKGNATVLLSDFFLKNPGFSQKISGEIIFESVNDNLVNCNFQKTVSQNGKTTDYPSYLKFSKEGDLWKIVEEGDKITDYNIGKQNESIEQQTILNNWIKTNIGSGIVVDLKTIKEAGLNTSNYRATQAFASSDNNDYFNVTGLKPEISASKNWIIIAFNRDGEMINFFLGKEKVFRSYHLAMGSNGGSTSYDLVSREYKGYSFTVTGIKGDLVSMYRDGYGFDNNGEPTGHWWQSGTYDIITGNTSWGAKEH